MPEKLSSLSAFTREYLKALRDREEPQGGDPLVHGPLVLHERGGRFLLYRPWQSPEMGDEPEAEFATREEALLFLASRPAISRGQLYELLGSEPEPGDRPGHPVVKKNSEVGRLRTHIPEWVYAAHVLACLVSSPENLAAVLEAAGPAVQEEVGQILGRGVLGASA
ncbi:MAG TPA: hypothetical protein VE685_26855 [Thermoanaerobaculia bacterium]|nr:hypothetical protein [Thermoanaerobaculia bacterium]